MHPTWDPGADSYQLRRLDATSAVPCEPDGPTPMSHVVFCGVFDAADRETVSFHVVAVGQRERGSVESEHRLVSCDTSKKVSNEYKRNSHR